MTDATLGTLVPVISAFLGLTVGLFTPSLNQRLANRTSFKKEQRDIAERILQLWQRDESIVVLLRGDVSGTRRMLLLLSARLANDKARTACLRLLEAAEAEADDGILLDIWSDSVHVLSHQWRRI